MLKNRKDLIRNIPFFALMSPDDIDKIVNILEEVRYPANSMIFIEGEQGDTFYVVEKGLVEMVKSFGSNEERVIGRGGANEFFGEMALIDDEPRSATVRAIEDSVLLRITKEQFKILMEKNPRMYSAIATTLTSRLRETHDTTIKDLQTKNLELERAYRKLKETQEELIRSEKMAAIGSVSSRVVHDIKNLLTSIQGFAEIIRTRIPESKRFTDAIVQQVRLMVEMTQEILDFARGEESVLEFEKISVGIFCEELLGMLKNSLGRADITIRGEFNYTGYAWFDEVALRRVIHNLVNNAKDAFPKGKGGQIIISTSKEDSFWVIKVADNGKGIPEHIREKLFEPFVTYGKSNGTGLGLAICKKLVEGHKGTIYVETEIDKGTTFSVRLPINPTEP